MFKLVIQDDEGKTTVVPLIRDEITIGRKEGNTIRLTERNVSRRHARILRNNGEVHIEDLGSYNGIRVNNARIAERVSLRVSDQVQIGDYKLYLKAEGVEQVDDARTMPIERVDTNGTATEAMAAVPPTTQMPAQAAAPIPPTPSPVGSGTGPQLIGNPNRTLVAIADTDPQGRPVATAATVAALSAPVGYGKLVVISSNFAGKEYELSRPQMIIGRTDENDIVVNHRSISRNHAKLVREPDTGRYTISDLQSSNGVRVNGQDYGKVELRRGDVVDLGHVRLRFVEPGEDFVFARDAVITDVPDSGNRKGMVIAVVLGIVVLGAVAAFFFFKNSGNDEPKIVKPGSDRTENGTGGGTDLAGGSGGSNPVVGELPIDAGSAAPTIPTNASDDLKTVITRCVELKSKRKWAELQTCGNEVASKGGNATEFLERVSLEQHAEMAADNVSKHVKGSLLREAQKELLRIPEDSVYRQDAQKAVIGLERSMSSAAIKQLQALQRQRKCTDFNQAVEGYKLAGLTNIADNLKCETVAIADHPPDHPPPDHPKNPDHPKDPGNGSQTVTPPQPSCNVTALMQQGDALITGGDFSNAEGAFRAAYKCKADSSSLQRAYLSACKANHAGSARELWRLMSPSIQNSNTILQICMNSGIDVRKP